MSDREIEAMVCSLTCVEQYLIEADFDAAAVAVREASKLLETQAAAIAALRAQDREDGARDLRVAQSVWAAAVNLDALQANQPEWLWYEHEHGRVSHGRWPRVAGSAPYVRADIASGRAALNHRKEEERG